MTVPVLAVIPARGGSKGLPRKNLRDVAGKPLLVWTIEAVRGATLVDRWVVSTEDPEIAAVARRHGAAVLDRPTELADDHASTLAVVQHALAQVPAEIVVVLHPTSPIRRHGLIDACVRTLTADGVDSLGTVHRDYSFEYGQDMPRRQEIRPRLVDNGNVYVIRAATLRAGQWIGERISVVETSREESVEIDDEFDLWLAGQVLAYRVETQPS